MRLLRILSKRLGFVPAGERKRIRLEGWPRWRVEGVGELPAFLRALPDLIPPRSVLYLEGASPPPQVRAYLERRAPESPTPVELGTIWPRPTTFHMSATEENLLGLARLAEARATPEIAIHLHVYREGRVLLEWHDAFSQPLAIAAEIPEPKVQAFCARLGAGYERDDGA